MYVEPGLMIVRTVYALLLIDGGDQKYHVATDVRECRLLSGVKQQDLHERCCASTTLYLTAESRKIKHVIQM